MENLLVCTDGAFPYTESCFKYAEWIAKKMGASLDVLYVSDSHAFDFSMMADFSGGLGAQPYQNLYAQLKEVEQEKAKVVQEMVRQFFEKADLSEKVHFHHETGSLVDCYQKYENSARGLDLVILGKRGENANFATEHLGSNLERVVRSSKRPCFVACRQYSPIQKVALAYDDSPSVRHAIQFLIRSPLFKDTELNLIAIHEDDETVPESVLESLAATAETLQDAGYKVKTTVIQDEVSDGVTHYITDNKIDLLIMGAYGHSVIRHLLIGSITTDLIRRCKTSVLLFR